VVQEKFIHNFWGILLDSISASRYYIL